MRITPLALALLAPLTAHAEHTWLFGLKGTDLAPIEAEQSAHLGGGAFVEYLAVPHWLEVELTVQAFGAEGGALVPVELLAKKPFHLSHAVHPFVGLGPQLVVTRAEGHTATHLGGLAAAGSYFWVTEHVGALAELSYGVVSEGHLLQEIGGTVGLVVGL